MLDKILDRRNFVVIIILVLFGVLFLRLADITIIQGEEYRKLADDSFLKRISLTAERGEIYDTNGVLLAGNIPSYTVQFLDAPQYEDEIDRVCIDLLTLLEERDEEYLSFPIQIINDNFYFTDTLETESWLEENEFPKNSTAEFVYEQIRTREFIDEELDVYDAQNLLLYKGIILPISVRSMKFLDDIQKEQFLEYYGLDESLSAEEAFQALRDHRRFRIDEDFTAEEALKIMTVRHAFNQQGYLSYIPIDIAKDVSKQTAVLIQEMGLDFPGVSIYVEAIRDYPFDDTAAHIIGFMGKISSQREIDKYIETNGYKNDDLIGKTGLEYEYEDTLHGQDGYKYIYADVKGNYLGDFIEGVQGKEAKESHSGDDIQLTIDIEFQKKVEEYLKKGLDLIQTGGTYESQWGDWTYPAYENAVNGAVVVVKVDTGEVLALANYPSYDLNLFSTGITQEDWESLQPENPRNPLGSRPLYNIATNTAVQPGSTFKMVTVLAALEMGLDPEQKLYANGVIDLGSQLFRCWVYRAPYHSRHGSINALQALQVSCNYFMADIVRGYDYYRERPLDFEMNTETLLSYADKLGLGQDSGIEIFEDSKGLPSEDIKRNTAEYTLSRFLNTHLDEYFSEEDMADEDYKEMIIDTIISWIDEYLEGTLSRNEVIRRLLALKPEKDWDGISPLADYIIYDYFKQIPWREGDDLNLSIGQGDHRYTVVQMVRYIATIANGGYLNELTLVKEVDGENVLNPARQDIGLLDPENLESVKEGMYMVAHEARGSVYKTFKDFDIKVGAKTGTAQKAGRIPPVDEVEYLREYLPTIVEVINQGISETSDQYIPITAQDLEALTNTWLEERNQEIADLQARYKATEDPEEKEALEDKITNKATSGYLDKGPVMRAALIELGQGKITDDIINEYRQEYDPFAWFVSFAPYEEPEIAVVVLIPQGGSGGYASPIVRDIYAEYFDLFDQE